MPTDALSPPRTKSARTRVGSQRSADPKRHGLLRRRSAAAPKPPKRTGASKSSGKPRTPTAPQSRSGRRQAAKVRRARFLLVCSVAFAALVTVAWFPAASLLHQRQAVSAASAQLFELNAQDKALQLEQANLNSPAEIQRIAREQYQLVLPGQRAYQVLPPNGSGAGAGNDPYAGDPALQPVVSPSAAVELPPGSVSSTTIPSSVGSPASGAPSNPTHAAPPSAHGTFLQRMLQTFEFWK